MTYRHPATASLFITIAIFVMANLLEKLIELTLRRFHNHHKFTTTEHRKVKKKKLMQRRYTTTYIGQKVKRKPQRIGRKIIDVAFASKHRNPKCPKPYKTLIHPLQNVTRLSKQKATDPPAMSYQSKTPKNKLQIRKQTVCLMTKCPKFDTDSYLIGIDNHSSVSISNSVKDFITPPQPCKAKIKSFGGSMMAASGIGSVKWKIADDQGVDHDIIIDDVLFVPQAQVRLLCPQQ